jgi:hypothetical protein
MTCPMPSDKQRAFYVRLFQYKTCLGGCYETKLVCDFPRRRGMWESKYPDYCTSCAYRLNQRDVYHKSQFFHREREWCLATLRGHRLRGFVVNIELDALYEHAIITKKCPYCGITIDWRPGQGHVMKGRRHNAPSLDRVNGDRIINHIWEGPADMSTGAVIIICLKCNVMKGTDTHWEFVQRCKQVTKYTNKVYGNM